MQAFSEVEWRVFQSLRITPSPSVELFECVRNKKFPEPQRAKSKESLFVAPQKRKKKLTRIDKLVNTIKSSEMNATV